jgi:hypothetical protein
MFEPPGLGHRLVLHANEEAVKLLCFVASLPDKQFAIALIRWPLIEQAAAGDMARASYLRE